MQGLTSVHALAILCTCFIFFCFVVETKYTPPNKAGVFLDDLICSLDPRVNASSIATWRNGTYIKQIKRYLWETACGRARGVFTLTNDPIYRGNTYSCANWPEQWGIKEIDDWFASEDLYEKHCEYLGLYLQGNYNTTAVHGPSTCDFVNLALLSCGKERFEPWRTAPWAKALGNKPFRGVNTGGVFVLEPWITPNFTKWTYNMSDQYTYSMANPMGSPGYNTLVNLWTKWYTPDDFKLMKQYGLNSIRVPVGWWYFAKAANVDPTPYTVPTQEISDLNHPIAQFIKMAQAAGLSVVLDLHGAPGSQNGLDNSGKRSYEPNPAKWGYEWFYDMDNQDKTTQILVQMAKWIEFLASQGVDNVIALELLNEPWVFGDMSIVRDFYKRTINAIRQFSKMPIIIHDAFRHQEWEWLLIDFPYENVFMDTHIYHAFNTDDQASSTENCDRNKMIVAQNIACGYGSMLRFKTCTSLPTLLGEFSLAIDDCMGVLRGVDSWQYKDFGQCKHLEQRLGNSFWSEAYQKFALKQFAMAERELGWFFWTWKTGPGARNDPSNHYWSFSDAVKNGLIPTPLDNYDQDIQEACYVFESTEPYTC